MATQIFTSKVMNSNDILDVGQIEKNSAATASNHVVNKSEAESIAALAVQTAIVSGAANASGTSGFSSEYTQNALNAKQDTMSVDASSSAYLEIVDGTKIKLKDLGIGKAHKHTASTTLADMIAAATFNGDGTVTLDGEVLDKLTFIFLPNAPLPQDRSVIYLGTDNGSIDDFVQFNTQYNTSEIRTFFSGTGVGMSFDQATGSFSLDYGTSATKLGAQTVPVDVNEFNNIAPTTVLAGLKQLEELIEYVDVAAAGGQATAQTRLNNLSGVTGNSLLLFTQGLFSDNKSIKEILQESETLHKTHIQEAAAIRAEAVTEAARVDASILTEKTRAEGAEATLQSNINAEAVSRATGDATQQANLLAEAMTRSAEDTAIKDRLDCLEGTEEGSVAKAEADAKAYADSIVLTEKTRAQAAEAALDTKIDNLQEGDITFVGTIDASGDLSVRQARIDAGDTRNGQNIDSIDIQAGEEFVMSADATLSLGSTTLEVETGDKLMAVDDITSGSATDVKFNVVQASGSAISIANIDGQRIEKTVAGKLDLVADSVTRTQLSADVEADIDDKRSLTTANAITSDGDTHFVTSTSTDAQQNVYFKREQTSSDALTGTARAVLAELHVNSNGSANPLAPSYAHTATMATHYVGDCVDLSMVIAGGNFEGNGSATTATQATGVYGTAIKSQLGVNVGGTFVADGAAVSNLGAFGFASTDGVGADRGLYGAVAAMDVATFSATRTADPVPYNDVAVVADAKYAPAGSKAFYAWGDVVLEGGSVTVPSAVADTDAVNLGDIKAKQRIFEFDLSDGVAKTISVAGFDLDKCIIQVKDNGAPVSVSYSEDNINKEVTVTATGGDVDDVRLLIQELSCDVTQA